MLKRTPKTQSSELVTVLNTLLGTIQVQSNNLRAAHWNIRGDHSFLSFHSYLDELYNATSAHADKIAEFVRIHGDNTPIFTLKEYNKQSVINECIIVETQDIDVIIKKALLDIDRIMSMLKAIFAESGKEPDINDYMAMMIDEYGKRAWFLSSSQKS